MAVLVSPGVLTREIDLSLYVPALTSTILALVGTATKGQVDVPSLITDVTQLAKVHGDPHPNHPAILVAQWYLKFGRQLRFIRVASNTLASSTANLGSSAAGPAVLTGSNDGPFTIAAASAASVTGTEVGPFNITTDSNDKITVAIDGGGDQVVTLAQGTNVTAQTIVDAINAQTNGLTASVVTNHVKIESNTTGASSSVQIKAVANDAYTTLGFTAATVTGSAGTDLLRVVVSGGSNQDFTLTAGNRTAAQIVADLSGLTDAIASVSGSKVVITSTGTGGSVTVQVAAASTADSVLGFSNSAASGTAAGAASVVVTAASPGTWGDEVTLKIEDSASVAGTKNLTVMVAGYQREVFRNLSKTSTDAKYWETAINGVSEYITVEDQTGVVSQPANASSVALTGGDDGLSGLADADFIGVQGDGYSTGMQAVADKATIDINLLAVPGQSSMAVHSAMISLVSSRADSMCLVDPPVGLTPTQVVDFKRGMNAYSARVALNTNRAAMYYPWVQAYDPKNQIVVDLPPCAAAIRSYIYNDTVGELWFAPMGVNRGLIPEAVGIERKLREGEKDYIYENGINPIMAYNNYGVTIMGEKTLQVLPTSLDRVNVRRMMDYLHKAVVTVTFGLIGEPNTPRLWRRLVGILKPTLQYLKDREGITEFQIVCDATTNPQNLVNAHELHAKIGILPTPDAEFIYTDFVLVDSMATFQEYLAPAA